MKIKYLQALLQVKVWLLLFTLVLGFGAQSQIPNCDANVPTYNVNFVTNLGGNFVTPSVFRQGNCCGTSGSDRCLNFVVTVDTNSAGVSFAITAGAQPSGSMFFQIDCGPQVPVGGPVGCITTPGVHYVTFCKPGNNENIYTLSSVAKPIFRDDTIAVGCYDTLPVLGIKDSLASYTSIFPGALGQYNNYLSCANGCAKVRFTPDANAPQVIRYRVCGYAIASNCLGAQLYCDTITVVVAPQWNNTADQYICAPATTANLGVAPMGSVWSAIAGNPSPATIGASSGAVTGLTLDGTYKFLLTGNSGKCKDTVLVLKSVKPNAGADQSFCQPQSTTSLGAAAAGFSWSALASNPSPAIVGGSTGLVSGLVNAGTYLFRLASVSGCADTVAVVLKAQPGSPVTGSNSPLCTGQTLSLTASTVAGASYSWTGPGGFSSTQQNPSISNVVLSNAGTYTVQAIIAGCSSVASTADVVVNQTPSLPVANSNSPVCSGLSLNLSTAAVSGATYTWTGPNGFTSSSQTPTISSVTTAAGGSYNLIVTVSNCSSVQASTFVVINQTPTAPVASSNTPLCSGQTLSLQATTVAGATYSWSGPNGFSATTQSPSISNATTAASGTYNVTATVSNCPSSPASTTVLVNQTPAAPVLTNNGPLCYGDTLKLFSSTVAGSTYSWSGPSGFTSAMQNPIVVNATPARSGTYSVTVTISNCPNTTPASTGASITSCRPLALNDFYSTTEDQTLNVSGSNNVLSNDADPANPPQPLTVTTSPICNTSNGLLTLSSSGNFTYVPALNFNGLDSFCYRVCDNEIPVSCDTAVVYINVIPSNDPPVVDDLSVTTPEDQSILVCVNIADIESSQSHAVTVCDAPDNGNITNPIVNNVSIPHTVCFTYTPGTNFNGADSVCITVCDNGSPVLCDQAIIRITVTPINDAPIANNDTYVMGQDTATTRNVIGNDIDVDGPGVSITVICPTAYGTLSMAVNGLFTYTPPANFGLIDTFCYRYCDNGTPNLCDTAIVYLDYTGSNLPPVAVTDVYQIPEDDTLTENVLTNDFDPNAGSLLSAGIIPVQNVQHGTLSIQANGSFVYTPTLNYNGPDTFQYQVCDNGLPVKCDTGFVFITVTPVNDPPVVKDTAIITNEDVAITICLPISDLETGDLHSASVLVVPLHGNTSNLSVVNIGVPHQACFTYTPTLNYNGLDSLLLLVCDNGSPVKCDTAKILITVVPVNDAPIAVDDTYSGNEDTAITNNVLTNDSDVDGPSLSVPSLDPITCNPQHGGVVIAANGVFTYTPTSNYFGPDSFCYRICDNGVPNLCDTAVVRITIFQVNDKPVVNDSLITTNEDNPVVICLPIADNDATDSHSSLLCGGPAHGSISAVVVNNSGAPHTACFTYTPNANYNGTDSVCIVICDNGLPVLCDTAVVDLIVNPVNDPPYADTVFATTYMDQAVPVNVSSASGDLEGNPLTFSYGTPSVASTSVVVTGAGAVVVTPPAGFTGTINIPFTVCDLSPFAVSVLCDNGLVVVTVYPVNDTLVNHAPVAGDDYATIAQGATATVNVLANDFDIDGDALLTTLTSSAQHGFASLNTTGTMTYQPNSGYTGFDTIYYSVCDPFGITLPRPLCDNGMVVIYVSGDSTATVNDKPVATDDYSVICADASSAIDLLENDSDPNGNAITSVILTSTPSGGTLTASGFGLYTYTPTSGFSGTDTFTYSICDNGIPSLCDTGSVVLVVRPTPILTSSVNAVNSCSEDSVHILYSSNIPGAIISWTASNGTSSTGNVHVQLINNSTVPQTITYTASIVSTFGCGGNVISVPVTVTPNPITSINALITSVCSGDQVTILVSSSQQSGQLVWSGSNGSSGTGNVIVDNPVNNTSSPITVTYTVVNTFNGCVGDTVYQSVTVKPRPVITVVAVPSETCSGEGVIVNITSNVPGTSFSWSSTSGLFGSGALITDFPSTQTNNASVNVLYVANGSAAGCAGLSASDTVLVHPNPVVNAGLDQLLVDCAGLSATLGGSPTVSGGSAPISYTWSPAAGLSATNIANPVVSGISVDVVYFLTVTDNFGCSATDETLVDVIPNSLSAEAGAGGYNCINEMDSVMLGGFPTAVGGDPTYIYTWSPLAGLNITNLANPSAKPLVTTLYHLTVTDQFGCEAVDSALVTVKESPTATASADTTICANQGVQLGGSPTGAAGTGVFTYTWSPVSGLNSSTVENPIAVPVGTTTYTVTVLDQNGCSAVDNVVVTVRTNPVVNGGPDKNLSLCASDSVSIGSIPLVQSGGSAPFTYSWSPATGLNSNTVANPIVSGISVTSSYQVIVTDNFGCTGSDNAVVNVLQQTLQAQAGTGSVICAAAGTPIGIGGNPTAVGGTPPYIYNWSPASGLSSTSASNPTATVSSSTTFYVTVTDSKGCISVDSVSINQNPSPIVNAGADADICAGAGRILGGTPSVNGGTPPYQYSWAPTTGLSANNTSNPSAFPLITTTYQLLVTDSNGCQASDAVTIFVNQNPIVNAGPDLTLVACVGDSVMIGGSPSASNGGGGFVYSWSPVAGLSSVSVANPFVKGISSSTVYALTVTDANGCSAADAVVVNVVQSSLQANAGNNQSTCSGSGEILALGGNPTAIGGFSPFSYTWSPSTSLSSTTVANPLASPVSGATYYLTVTDARGCIDLDTVLVSVLPVPTASAGSNVTLCQGESFIAGGAPTAGGGLGPYVYEWSPSIGVDNTTVSNPEITPLTSTGYNVLVTDANGCTASDGMFVIDNANPSANAGSDQTLIACSGDSVLLGGTPTASFGSAPYTYQWSPLSGLSSSTSSNPYVSQLGSGATFTVTVTDNNGCTASDQTLISVSNGTLFAEAGNNVTVCEGAFAPIQLGGTPTVTGGVAPFIYSWSPATGLNSTTSANPAASPTLTTKYTLVVTDGAGCFATDTVFVIVNRKPLVNAGLNDTVCQSKCVTLGGNPVASGGKPPYVYGWLPSLYLDDATIAQPVACPINDISYTLTVTDSLGCSNTDVISIKVNQNPVANAGPDQTVVSCTNACITIGGSPAGSGGSAPYTYAWSPNIYLSSPTVPNPVLCNLKFSYTYTLTVTDINGCSATDQVATQVVPSSLTADAGPDKTSCAGANTCITIGGATAVLGGSPPYVVSWSPGAYFCNSTLLANPSVNPLDTTQYVLLVQDAQGCVAVDSMFVFANPAVTASVEPDTTICNGGFATLGGLPFTGSGGTSPYSYSWSPLIGLSSSSAANPSASPAVTTSYCVTVTDLAGCTASTCQTVNVVAPITADAGGDKILAGCPNSSTTLGGSPVVLGGSGAYTFQWTPNIGLDSVNKSNPVVTGLLNTTVYTLQITDVYTGCTATDQVLVTVVPSTLSVEGGTDQSLCHDDLNGVQIGGIPTSTGGVSPVTYTWSPAQGLSDTTSGNPTAAPAVSTTYFVQATDALGCTAADSIRVNIIPADILDIVGLNSKYCTDAGNIVLIGSPPGGTFNGPGVTGNLFQPALVGAGTWCINYTYTTLGTGCITDTTICVQVDSLPVVSASGFGLSYCQIDTLIELTGSPAGGIFSGSGITGNAFNPAQAQVGNNQLSYIYTDNATGCSNTFDFEINTRPIPALTLLSSQGSVCPGADVQLTAEYSIDVFNIVWTNLAGTSLYSGLNSFGVNPNATSRCYIATAINTPGCINTDTICINLLDCTLGAANDLCDDNIVFLNSNGIVYVLNNDTLPAGTDTLVTILNTSPYGTATVNSDLSITVTPNQNYIGPIDFIYQVCVDWNGFEICDQATVCVNVLDTTILCIYPNTITPNNDGVNEELSFTCNDSYPNASIKIFDRWGAEVYRSQGHYDNKWKAYNEQGIQLPDGTYFYIYFFNDGSSKMKKGFVDVYR